MRRVLVVCATLSSPTVAHAQLPDSLPSGVTAPMIAEGKTLYGGAGICVACHGPAGKGIQGLGSDLTDTKWLHSDGSFEAIVKQIKDGVPADKSSTGTVMPPNGGSQLTDPQVRAVAAYVWSLGRPQAKDRP